MKESPPTPTHVDEVIAEFEKRKELLTSFCERTRSLISECLNDAGIRCQSIQARVKSSRKLREKYTNPKKNYRRLDDVKDLAALRIITYYEDEVDQAAKVIEREFEIDRTNSIDKRQTDPEKFGYFALNYVCRHSETRRRDVEYKKYANVDCEIQITSILRHAWSEIQHDWYDLRDSFPDPIKRRFSRMAALLEIAESEFLELRKKKSDYIRSVGIQIEAQVPDVPLDPVSLKSFVLTDIVVHRVDKSLARIAGRPVLPDITDHQSTAWCLLALQAGFRTARQLRDALQKYEKGLTEYFARCLQIWNLAVASDAPRPMQRGVCVAQLSIMLMCNSQTEDSVRKTIPALAALPGDLLGKQIVIAKEIVPRYP
jgi:ppGpp synthetase/RelA/SpoT-type nucleotidyltranferase